MSPKILLRYFLPNVSITKFLYLFPASFISKIHGWECGLRTAISYEPSRMVVWTANMSSEQLCFVALTVIYRLNYQVLLSGMYIVWFILFCSVGYMCIVWFILFFLWTLCILRDLFCFVVWTICVSCDLSCCVVWTIHLCILRDLSCLVARTLRKSCELWSFLVWTLILTILFCFRVYQCVLQRLVKQL